MKYRGSSKKLCILVDSLGSGGAERSAGLLSKALAAEGLDVHIVIFIDVVQYEFEGVLFNLGKKYGGTFFQKIKKYKALQKYLKQEDFDVILDFRMKDFPSREILLNLLVFQKERWINMVRSGNLDFYFPKPASLSKKLYANYLGINSVSVQLQKQIEKAYGFKNVFSIASPLDFDEVRKKSEAEKIHPKDFIVSAGRMDLEDTKQFGKLIFSFSKLPLNNQLDLLILGEGANKKNLLGLIEKLKLNGKVHLIPFQNPYPFFEQAKFYVLTSKYEGFPRVVIESLACGTPVVAFNCDFGPGEVIKSGFNGILVENQNFDVLEIAMQKMNDNKGFYDLVSKNSFKSVQKFHIKKIGAQWREYLQTPKSRKR